MIGVSNEILNCQIGGEMSSAFETRGLFGTANANNDLLAPDGTSVAHNASQQEIFYTFGEKCKCPYMNKLFS